MTASSGPLTALRFIRNNGKWLAGSAFAMCVFAMVALYGQLNGSDSYVAARVRSDIAAVGNGADYARDVISIRQLTMQQRPPREAASAGAAGEPSVQRALRSPLAADGSLEDPGVHDRNASRAAAAAASTTVSFYRPGDKDNQALDIAAVANTQAPPPADDDQAARRAAIEASNEPAAVGRAVTAAALGAAPAEVAVDVGPERTSTRPPKRRRSRTTTSIAPPGADVTAAGSVLRAGAPPREPVDHAGRLPNPVAPDAAVVPTRAAGPTNVQTYPPQHGGADTSAAAPDNLSVDAKGLSARGRGGAADAVSMIPPLLAADPAVLVPKLPSGNREAQLAFEPRNSTGSGPVSWQELHERGLRRRVDYIGGQSYYRATTGPPPPPIRQWETYDYESAVGVLDIHVEHAPDVMSTNLGEPWPMPQHYLTSYSYHPVDTETFKFVAARSTASDGAAVPPGTAPPAGAAEPWCGRLQRAVSRYTDIVKETVGKVAAARTISPLPHNTLAISLLTPCSDQSLPHEGMDESYHLRVDAHGMQLTAVEIWGVLRGLETFSQLLHVRDGLAVINETVIRDYPSYGYRGVMLDTARHFLPVQYIKRSLDAMSYNKFNVFHWHIVDDNSFPYESKKFPELHKKGAYSSSQVYSVADVRDIIAYAADRGIRVVPEFDTPGHTRSWGNAFPTLLTNCSADFDPFGAVNPIQKFTYDFLMAFFEEVKEVFPDSYMHIGGDEINYKCWLAVKEIREFMLAHNMTTSEYQYNGGIMERLNGKQLQGYYTERLLAVMPPNTKKIAWDEAFVAAVQQNLSRSDLVIHVWQQGDMWQQLASQVLNEGFSVIVSACWYLNYISYGIDWHKYYECDLKSFEKYYNIVPDKRAGMLGGSVCLWSEHIDENNLEPILWPRAIAPAEKLWSSELLVNPLAAQGRFEQQHCRLLRRGVRAAPGNGPGSCLGTMKVKPPM